MKIKRGIATLCIISVLVSMCVSSVFAQGDTENQD